LPQCLFIISWDQLEGAIITSKFPPDVEVNLNSVQTIDVAHSFNKESPWVVVEDKGFKAVSYYNEALLKSIALVLHPNEVPNNFVKFLEQLAEFVLPVQDEESISRRLQEAFSLVQAEIPVTEVVLLNFANEIQQLKEKAMDLNIQIRGIMELATDLSTKILLYLLVSDGGSTEEKIVEDFAVMGHGKAQIDAVINSLLKKKHVEFNKNENKYILNLLAKPTS
jgi:hypothetical protein